MYHIRDNFPKGMKIVSIPLSWFRAVAGFINSLCPGTGIKMTNPGTPSAETPVAISIDETYLKNKILQWAPSAQFVGPGGNYVPILDAESTSTPAGGAISSQRSDVTPDSGTWTAMGSDGLVIRVFTRIARFSEAIPSQSSNTHLALAFWREMAFNPNGTLKSVSAEKGYVVFAIT